MTIYVEKVFSPTDPRLKRHVKHDARSRAYAHDTRGLTIAPVEHKFNGPTLDQKQTGKCTAECGLDLLKTDPYYSPAVQAAYEKAFGSFDDTGTDAFYSLEETHDGDGPFPPNDNGSSGLTMAWVMRKAGIIPGWTQVFSPTDFLKALTQFPIGAGSYWYKSMFEPDASGRIVVDPTSGVAGGHEYECVGYDGTKWLKFKNSWGDSFGDDGFFYADADTWLKNCLQKNGDGTIFAAPTGPAPVPTPSNAFYFASLVLDPWSSATHVGSNAKAAKAWQTYSKAVRS